jgi:site-specific recombinase XerD
MVVWLGDSGWSSETKKSHRSALHSFYRWAHTLGRIDHDPAQDLPPVRLIQPQARPTPEPVLRQALASAPYRVRLMIVLAAKMGLRRGEIARIHVSDISVDAAGASTLLVHGKGSKQRWVPMPDKVAFALRNRGSGWVFPSQAGGHLTADHVGWFVGDALNMPGWTTHTLRHRFASVSYRGSRDLLSMQTLLGHSSPATTQRYVQLPDDAMRAAMSWAA